MLENIERPMCVKRRDFNVNTIFHVEFRKSVSKVKAKILLSFYNVDNNDIYMLLGKDAQWKLKGRQSYNTIVVY